MDLEHGDDNAELNNDMVHSLGWRDVTVSVEDSRTKSEKNLLSNINGLVYAGEILAILGPSYVVMNDTCLESKG